MKRKFILPWFCLFSLTFLVACKTTAKREQRKTDQQREVKQREEQRAYNKAFKAHLNRQDKGTKKRIKNNIRAQQKMYKENHSKGKVSNTCPKTK